MEPSECWRCKYFVPAPESSPVSPGDNPGDAAGDCRRRAPVAGPHDDDDRVVHYARWPIVVGDDWCGEFAPRSTATPEGLETHATP